MKFKIPQQFQIGPHHIKVKHVDVCTGCDSNTVGLARYAQNTIELKTGKVDRDYKEFVFFHEVMHHVLTHIGYTKLSTDEAFCDRIAGAILQVIKTME